MQKYQIRIYQTGNNKNVDDALRLVHNNILLRLLLSMTEEDRLCHSIIVLIALFRKDGLISISCNLIIIVVREKNFTRCGQLSNYYHDILESSSTVRPHNK